MPTTQTRDEAQDELDGAADEEAQRIADDTGLDVEIVKAAQELGIDEDHIAEAYQGQFSSDEDFAQEMAEQLGDVPKDSHWPLYCIDWEWAARELMMDYCEQDGYYFRNL